MDEQEIDPVTGDYIASFLSDGAAEVKVRVQDIGNQITTQIFTLNIMLE